MEVSTINGPVPFRGLCVRSAFDCWYPPAVHPTDLLRVDFDVRAVDSDGLYLVEEVQQQRVVWRGCRRYRVVPEPHRLEFDARGDGSWTRAAVADGWRIAGKVVDVYRRSH